MEVNTEKKLIDFYESEESLAWDIISEGNLHLGYWDDENRDKSFGHGVKAMTRLMMEKTDVTADQRFCDIGCGTGMPAMMPAKEKGCYVDGITISPLQKKMAEQKAADAGLADRVRFHAENALSLPFADNHFDGCWFFESIFHMGRREALLEARRVLKPGASVVLTDMLDLGVLNQDDKELLMNLSNTNYIKIEDYPGLLEETGFELVELTDITKEVMGVLDVKFAEAVNTHRDELSRILDGERLSQFAKTGELIRDIAGYVILKARKPV